MAIFANDSSEHLLLNDDLIQITLGCLENSHNITNEVRFNVSKLLSKVLQNARIQSEILLDGVDNFKGINLLLGLIDEKDEKRIQTYLDNDPDNLLVNINKGMLDLKVKIVKYIIEGCFHLAKNPILFKNQEFSLLMMEPLLAIIKSEIKLKVFN